MKKQKLQKITLSSIFLAFGMALPFLTMQIKEIGDSLLPMHIPVMLCGILCGYGYGAAIGFILPFLRSVCFGMPPIYPNAVWMSAELLTYGIVIGLLYKKLPQNLPGVYLSLILSQISGRIIWGLTKTLLLSINGKFFTFTMFISGGFVDAIPGIILQLLLIPTIISILKPIISKWAIK